MKRINVLHFTRVINRNDFIDAIIRHADRSKFYLMAASYKGEFNIENPQYEKAGVPFFTLNIDHGWMSMFVGAWRLRKILKKNRIDILHSHHFYESVISQMACLFLRQCKHVIGRHYHNQFYITASGLKLKFYLFVEGIINHLASCIVVPSTAIVDLLLKQGVVSSKIKMIPYGFDFKEPRYNSIPGSEVDSLKMEFGWCNKFIIGNIGRQHSIKGQSYLIHAFTKIHKAIAQSKLVLIGDGPHHSQLVELVDQLELNEYVEFLGWRNDAHKLINIMDVVIHPTLQEAFPQIMIETMALAKPIIITPVSGATDVIKNGVNGILIEPQNSDSIVKEVTNLFSNKSKLSAMGLNAFSFVRAHYSKDEIIPRFENLYLDLISKSKD